MDLSLILFGLGQGIDWFSRWKSAKKSEKGDLIRDYLEWLKALLDGKVLFEVLDNAFSIIENDDLKQILSCIATGGDRGFNLRIVSTTLGENHMKLLSKLEGLSTGGVLAQLENGNMAVIPVAFRCALLRNTIFKSGGLSLEAEYWEWFAITESKTSALMTLLEAIGKGAESDLNIVVDNLKNFGNDRLWKNFASISEECCKLAWDNCQSGRITLAEPALVLMPDQAIPYLLESSIGDDRPEHSTLSAPQRIIDDWIKTYSYREKNGASRRVKLLSIALEWFCKSENFEVIWKTIPKCMSLDYSGHDTDPGDERKLFISRGTVSFDDLKEISKLWSLILDFIKNTPPQNWNLLTATFHAWLFPNKFESSLSDDYREFCRDEVQQIFNIVIKLKGIPENALRRWGASHQLCTVDQIDEGYLVLWPLDPLRGDDDYMARFKKCEEDAKKLGIAWASRNPNDVAKDLVRFREETNSVSDRWSGYEFAVNMSIATEVQNINDWIDAYIEQKVHRFCLEPFLREAVQKECEDVENTLLNALSFQEYRGIAISLILSSNSFSVDAVLATYAFLEDYRQAIGGMILRHEMPLRNIKLISKHDSADLMLDITLGDLRASNPMIFEQENDLWLEMFRKGINKVRRLESEFFYDLDYLIKKAPEVVYDLVVALIENVDYINLAYESEYQTLFNALSREQKIELLPRLIHAREDELASALIDQDVELYKELLKKDDLKRFHLAPLEGSPTTSTWQEKAKLALDHGYKPDEVAWAARENHMEYSKTSVYLEEWKQSFESLQGSDHAGLQAVAKAGVEMITIELDKALKCEKDEDIYGRYN